VLAASNGSYDDELYIRFDEESTPGFELKNDAYKFLSNTQGLSQLYSFADETIFSIDVRPQTEVIQLGFQNTDDGNYSINILEMEGVSSVSIEDTKTNTTHNFKDGIYNFDYSSNDDEKRFRLHMQVTGIDELSGNDNYNVYVNNKTIYVKSENAIDGSITIYDVCGRTMHEQTTGNSQFVSIPANYNPGMYIVVVENGIGISSEKVLIK
jgi:hypothetical protein